MDNFVFDDMLTESTLYEIAEEGLIMMVNLMNMEAFLLRYIAAHTSV